MWNEMLDSLDVLDCSNCIYSWLFILNVISASLDHPSGWYTKLVSSLEMLQVWAKAYLVFFFFFFSTYYQSIQVSGVMQDVRYRVLGYPSGH